jgi:MAE_28990/MAE_18760-like HEPN
MFQDLVKTVISDADTVTSILLTNDRFRTIFLDEENQLREELIKIKEIASLIDGTPNEVAWRVYDHCSTVTRLYAVYEKFVKNLITDWLEFLPNCITEYKDLEKRIRDTHRIGVGRLLVDLSKNRFEHLSVEKVVRSLFSGVNEESEYDLIPDAFLLHEQNLRKDELNKLICDAGIDNAWDWIQNHREVKQYMADDKKAESELNQLVLFRNQAAHGATEVDEILGVRSLVELAEFVKVLCMFLEELFAFHVLEKKAAINKFTYIGNITEWFNKPNAGVAKIRSVSLSQGDRIVLASKTLCFCCITTVESIHLNDTSYERLEVKEETEVGLKFSVSARKGLGIYVEPTGL